MNKVSLESPSWLIVRDDGWLLQLWIHSGARQTRIDGVHDGRLKLHVQAPPIDGRANQAITDAIAHALGVARGRVQLVSGFKSKQKTVLVGVGELTQDRIYQGLCQLGWVSESTSRSCT